MCLRRPSFVLPGISVIRFASEALAYLLPSFNIINHYPLDENYENLLIYPVDSDLYNGYCYPPFEQLGSGLKNDLKEGWIVCPMKNTLILTIQWVPILSKLLVVETELIY